MCGFTSFWCSFNKVLPYVFYWLNMICICSGCNKIKVAVSSIKCVFEFEKISGGKKKSFQESCKHIWKYYELKTCSAYNVMLYIISS